MITSGEFVGAKDALALGIVDVVDDGNDVKAAGLAFAQKIADEGKPVRRVRDLTDKLAADKSSDVFDQFRAVLQRKPVVSSLRSSA